MKIEFNAHAGSTIWNIGLVCLAGFSVWWLMSPWPLFLCLLFASSKTD